MTMSETHGKSYGRRIFVSPWQLLVASSPGGIIPVPMMADHVKWWLMMVDQVENGGSSWLMMVN